MAKIKTEWDLGLYYNNEKDSKIEKDTKSIEKAYLDFAKKYRGKDFTSTAQKLLTALRDYDKLLEKIDGYRPYSYFIFRTVLDAGDKASVAASQKIQERLLKVENEITFFKLVIADIPASKQKEFLKDRCLSEYRYMLQYIFARGRYKLTEKEEQLASLLSIPAYAMWVDGHSRPLSQKTVEFDGKQLPLSEATGKIFDLPKKKRTELQKKLIEVYKSVSDFTEAEINAIVTLKKLMDERRGYEQPYSETVLNYENTKDEVENLVSTISKNFKISHRFYKLHAKLLKQKKLNYEDRGVKYGKINKNFDFSSCVDITKLAFSKANPEYSHILDRYLANGQIDVYPKKGKEGGAFCAFRGKLPVMVMLNHSDNIRSLETLAHEMGHAIHSEFSKSQPYRYMDYTISTAEVASTFFELVLSQELEQKLSDKEKLVFLSNRVMGDISTIFRQTACFNFENELHLQIREKGNLPKEEIAELMAKHFRSYMGPAVEVKHDDGYFFVDWSHIRRFFYVYTYAYGQLISRALFEKWREDPSYIEKIEQFFKAGGSMSPRDIFKSIGIDTTNPKFFADGLKAIEKDIEKLEKLAKKLKV